MKLVKYRDAGMHTYTYFFVNSDDRTISPFFDSEKEADEWMNEQGFFDSINAEEAQRIEFIKCKCSTLVYY